MVKKLFVIGERSIGGVIEVSLDKEYQFVQVRALDIQTRELASPLHDVTFYDLAKLEEDLVIDFADSYHAEKILKWLAKNGFVQAANDVRFK